MDIGQFREDFPEFGDDEKYPDSMVTFWSGIAEARLNQARWENLYTHGLELATAHYLTLAAENAVMPGSAPGLAASESAGDVSVSYDTSAISIAGAGHWNQTVYGRQFMELSLMAGTGGVQL